MKSQEEIAISKSKKSYNDAVRAIRKGVTIWFKPAWQINSTAREGKVVEKYEYHFLVKSGKLYESFTYTDVMLGEVQVRR